MCFSAEASFGLAAALVPAGVYCVRSAIRRRTPALLPLAIVPLLFAGQQAAEGFVWVGLGHDHPGLVLPASLVFLFFALCFWLFWIPFCLVCVERPGPLRWVLGGVTLVGVAVGLYLYLPVALHPDTLTTRVLHHSIRYDYPFSPLFPGLPLPVRHGVYLAIIALPLLTARSWQAFGLCVLLVLSAVTSQLVYWYAFASVWCFFAAILSGYLCVIFRTMPAEEQAAAERYEFTERRKEI